MTDVLESTAGYIDSELSDYEDNYREYNNTNNLNKYNHTNSNNKSLNNNNLYKWSKCVNKYELKSPRFGRDDFTNNLNKLDSNQNEKEYLCNRTSLDTVDTLTPLSNSFDKSFKWWKDDESHSNNSELLNDNTEEEYDNREDYVNDVDNSDNDLTIKNNNELLTEKIKEFVNDNNKDNIEWKSWTVGTNELNELKTKLLNKLLNNNSNNKLNDDLLNDSEALEDQEDAKWNELKYYKDMNRLLLNKLLWLLNNNNYKLEYNLNQQYITSIQNHLVKVHEYINSLTATETVNTEVDESNQTNQLSPNTNKEVSDNNNNESDKVTSFVKNKDKWEEKEEYIGFDYEDYERLKLENDQLKKQVQQLQDLVNSETNSFKSNHDNLVNNDSNNTVEDTEKKELIEKLKLVEESKNMLEEDFKKTLVYMRLMKDRLKFFKEYNTQKTNSNTTTTNNTTSNLANQTNVPKTLVNNNTVNQVVNKQQTYPVNLQTIHVNNLPKFVNMQFKPNQYVSPHNSSPLHRNFGNTGFGVVNTPPGGLGPTTTSLKPVTSATTLTNNTVNNNNTISGNTNTLRTSNTSTTTTNTSKFSPVNGVNNFKKRSNSCVRFKEESELYVVPRSLSETRPTISNNKFSKFFKLFSKS